MISDNAPVKPTCPMIDSVIDYIKTFMEESQEVNLSPFKEAIYVLEDIRKANGALRDWGNEYYLKADELESQVEYLQRENESLKSDLENQII